MISELDRESIEVELLLEAIHRTYGYDFRQYSRASITRRLRQHLSKNQIGTIAELIPRVLYKPEAFQEIVFDLSVTVTEMFRDPSFYRSLRGKVIPFLRTFPFANVWIAGCATGEEVYSLAIVLTEEGVYDRVRIYATDFNDRALQTAKERIYPLDKIQTFTSNYHKAGGKASLADYYVARYDAAMFNPNLQRQVTFANHNLVTDGVFAEMHLILCRNVLIYFTRPLQDRVFSLFRDSLCYRGFLCLGKKESIAFSNISTLFDDIVPDEKIYQFKGKQTRTNGKT